MVKISGGYAKIKKWVTDRLHTDHQVASAESAEFKNVNIPAGEGYKQATKIIMRIKGHNMFVGEDAGKVSTGDTNLFVGYRTGYKNTTGMKNVFVGDTAGYNNIGGQYNNFIGNESGYNNIGGLYNNFIGGRAGYSNTSGRSNIFIGDENGYKNIGGIYNVFIGDTAGYNNISGNSSVFIGRKAGSYETGSYKLFIDSISRASEADGRIKALIYGVFDAVTANQLIRLNAVLELTEIKSGATQAGAGVAVNEVWKTSGHATLPDNVLMIGV